jgi:hypothetical protein
VIKRFCDVCGEKIGRNYVSDRLEANRTFHLEDKRVNVKVMCMVAIDGTYNEGDICRGCVIDTVMAANTRSQHAYRTPTERQEADRG